MERLVSVEVGEDHLASFRRSPKMGIAELIWNALDADATEVMVEYELSGLGGIAAVIVRDNGTGMTQTDATFGFRNFGNSWKPKMRVTPGGRALHGQLGRGRYTAYSIGAHPVWTSVAEEVPADGIRREVTVTGNGTALRNVRISVDDQPTDKDHGTVVRIDQLTEQAERELLREGLRDDLIARFALYLEQYPEVAVVYRGKRLDGAAVRDRTETFQIKLDGMEHGAVLSIIEWKVKVERRLYLCTENGSALSDIPLNVQAPGYRVTAYLRWRDFQDLGHNILLAEMDDSPAGLLITAAKDRIRDYFKERQAERQREQIKEWEDDGVYPDFGDRQTPASVAERQVFELVALTAAPVVNEGSPRSRKIALNLIKTALESGPTALQNVLLNVLELPEDKIEELQELLTRTTLARMIETSKRIADRLDFLAGLDALVFDMGSRKQILERRQLHRILANETWIFGEEWALTGNDDRLTQVLATHLHRLGEDVEMTAIEPVLREDGSDAIPDLVLSRTLQTSENKYEHLVVELKRPSHRLTSADIDQLRSYAVAVNEDERFQQPNARWTYVLIGNSTSSGVDLQRRQLGQPYGRVQITERFEIWVRTWAEVVGDAQHRHKFVQRSLDYTADHDSGVEYLRQKHSQFLPDIMFATDEAPLAGASTGG